VASPDPAVVTLVPEELAIEKGCLALEVKGGTLVVAMQDPNDLGAWLAGGGIKGGQAIGDVLNHVVGLLFTLRPREQDGTLAITIRGDHGPRSRIGIS
jgi:hypothetical protein